MVLLFSFFFCSGGFLVAHADSAVPPQYLFDSLSLTASNSSVSGFLYGPGHDPLSFSKKVSSSGSISFDSGSGVLLYKWVDKIVFNSFSGSGTYLLAKDAVYFFSAWVGSPASVSAFKGSSVSIKYGDGDFLTLRDVRISTFSSDSFAYGASFSGYFICPDNISVDSLDFEFSVSQNASLQQDFFRGNINLQFAAASEDQSESVKDAVNSQGQAIQDKIESQYDTSQGSDVGSSAQDFADQAAESLGVVSYVDTLFSGLSGLVTAGSTTLTFPAFAIAVQGTDYQVWQEHSFDLLQLDGWFSGLMAAVRLATSVVVVGAVIHYLQSVYKDVIG